MMRLTSVLLLAVLTPSANSQSIEACNSFKEVDGTCNAAVVTDAKALRFVGYLQQLEALRAEAEEMRTAPCTAGSELPFRVVDGVQDQCPEGFEIASAKECRDAIGALGLEVQMIQYMAEGVTAPNVYEWSVPAWPVGCSLSHKNRLNFGVFNSEKAGTGNEHISLICRTSAWEDESVELPAASSEWSSGYERLEEAEGCPPNLEITSAAECEAAIGSLELESHDVIEAQQTFRPSGCSYFKEGRPGFPNRGLFNTWKEGRADPQFDPICRKALAMPEMPASFEEELDIDDDLEAEERDFSRLSMGTAGFVGGISKF